MLPTLPNLDGLIGLARQDGVDVRPTLLRVLTDLYVQKPAHTREEEHRFTELTLSLLTGVDVPARVAVARKLATYASAPAAVMRRLARDVFEVAEPILQSASCLTSDELIAIIKEFGPRYAAAIAARPDAQSSDATDVAPAPAPEPQPAPPAVTPTRSSRFQPISVGDYFLHAGSAERSNVLSNLEDAGAPVPVALATTPEAIAELESAALDGRPDDFAQALARILKISAERAQKIVADTTGEPVIVAAKAIAMPADVVLRILLFLNPVIGRSVERVFSLIHLHDQISLHTALHVVASWQNRNPAEQRHQALLWDDERRKARRTLAEHPRRFPLQVPDERAPPARFGQLRTRG
jgi:hypothetical protein